MSWGYYVFNGTQPDCDDNAMSCKAVQQNAKTPGIWNPLLWFDTVQRGRPARQRPAVPRTSRRGEGGTLPSVSWITPTQKISDHPPALITTARPT